MFKLFKESNQRVKIEGTNIFIDNRNKNIGKIVEVEHVFELSQPIPELNIFEDDKLVRHFKIDTLNNNPNLIGQFLHSSIRVQANSAVMIDGIISKTDTASTKWDEIGYEAIRLQPFYLSDADDKNQQLIGKGLFERGLHFSGTITPSGVRNICICDSCSKSFTIQHFHAGFSEVQYFYSSDSKETLIVPYGTYEDLPVQLQKYIDPDVLKRVESKLRLPSNCKGSFRYYNPFRCSHCSAPYIDFENNKASRSDEYYGNTYINKSPTL